ncbi:MAG: glycosyltransferase, partial [Acidobacteriaceae bacterium]|nr:glycosyltransferase [Acidobacteriaceae bacterium]
MSDRLVAVTIVTFNSAYYIATCLEHVLAQSHKPLVIFVVDNDSSDPTIDILRTFEARSNILISYNHQNLGFAAAQNQAIAA